MWRFPKGYCVSGWITCSFKPSALMAAVTEIRGAERNSSTFDSWCALIRVLKALLPSPLRGRNRVVVVGLGPRVKWVFGEKLKGLYGVVLDNIK